MLGDGHTTVLFLCPDVLTELYISYIICVTNLNRGFMTVTTNERGQQNMWAKEPRMYVDPSAALETQWERAEKANGRWAMMGIVAGFLSYAFTGNFFFGIF